MASDKKGYQENGSFVCPQKICCGYSIGLDKSGYQVNSFLIFRGKHMLWYSLETLTEALLTSTHNIILCFHREVVRKMKILIG